MEKWPRGFNGSLQRGLVVQPTWRLPAWVGGAAWDAAPRDQSVSAGMRAERAVVMHEMRSRARGALYGLAIGDALGMPTQSLSRAVVVARYGPLIGEFC